MFRLVKVFDVTTFLSLSLYMAFITDSSVLGFCCEVICIFRYQPSLYTYNLCQYSITVSSVMFFTTMLYSFKWHRFIDSRVGKMQKTMQKRRGMDIGCFNKKQIASQTKLMQRELRPFISLQVFSRSQTVVALTIIYLYHVSLIN